MNILIAPDKFKYSLSSAEASDAIKKGLLKASKDFKIQILPMADGGEGLSDVIKSCISAVEHPVTVSDPLFRPIKSSFLISKDGKTAFIEMAKASGLLLLKPEERNCMLTSTLGTGDLIRAAINPGVEKIILGIGGSATNEAGIGMATALGYRFLDASGKELRPIGQNLAKIATIDDSKSIDVKHINFKVACDVDNTLYGRNGASLVYSKQKGASKEETDLLEQGMIHFAGILEKHFGRDMQQIKGSGAAGGLGAGCLAFLGADLLSGIELVLKMNKAEEYIRQADLVITGEGKIDEQSLNGKAVSGLAKLCKKHQKPLIAFCGALSLSDQELQRIGVQKVYVITPPSISQADAYTKAAKFLADAAFASGKQLLHDKIK